MTLEERFSHLVLLVYGMTSRGIVYKKAMEELTDLWQQLKGESE